MIQVRLKGLVYKEDEYIGIFFRYDVPVAAILRKMTGCKWSRTNRCWLLPMSRENHDDLLNRLRSKAEIDDTALKDYLITRNKEKPEPGKEIQKAVANQEQSPRELTLRVRANINRSVSSIAQVNEHVIPKLKEYLELKAYSKSTIKTYINEMSQFLRTLGSWAADELTVDLLKRYLVYCYEKLKLSENTLHSRINALKFYFEQVLGRERFFWEIPRPKKHLKLPRLLNEEELSRLFNALPNRKHKAMLFTAYSAGLRVSELVNLKIADIDSERMQIFIENSKGKKDRYVNLSPLLLDILRNYLRYYPVRPRHYLFESEQTRTSYPIRTVQQIFSNAKRKAGIRKNVGIHSLRHSFATHLLDKGTDIKYIKELLGHFNIKTTERYLHVSKQQLVNVESPFDELWRKGNIEW